MKSFHSYLLLILLLICVQSIAQKKSENLKWQPQFPQVGDKVSFTYDASRTDPSTAKNIDAMIYMLQFEKMPVAVEVPLKQDGNKYSGEFTVDKEAQAISFSFSADGKKDANGNAGYLIPVYDASKKPVSGAYLAQAAVYNGMGQFLFDAQPQPELALSALETEFESYPENRGLNQNFYFQLLYQTKKKDAEPIIKSELDRIASKTDLTEKDYTLLSTWAKRFKDPAKSDSLLAVMKKKHPNGTWVRNEKLNSIYQEMEPAKKRALIAAFQKEFPAITDSEKQLAEQFKSMIADSYSDEKDWANFKAAVANLKPASKYSMYNNTAWRMAEKDEDLTVANEMAKEATEWAKNEVSNPSGEKHPMINTRAWENERKTTYGMYADTYAFILYKLKDYKNGLAYAKDAAEITRMKDPEYNDRYALLLEKNASPEQVKKEMEKLVQENAAGKEVKAILKRAYMALNKSDNGYDAYITELSRASREKMRVELAKKMISEPAPEFRLLNLEGKEVKLEQLKGKVVVLDFWATWCGPCIASFPGMQAAVNKFKSNPNVVFLFIDTWESGANREKLVKEFIQKNNYTFNVLYDIPQADNPDAFEVVANYQVEGIPAKFVLDGAGRIRFKSTGYGGSPDGLVDEISMMIDMVSTQSGKGTATETKKAFK